MRLETTIELRDVGFRYPSGLTALDRVSLSVSKGEIVSLIGPSGCGKSTLLNVVSGLLNPRAGQILLDSKDVADRRGWFAYMPQKDGLLPWRTSAGNAALLLEMAGVRKPDARRQALEMLEQFDLGSFAGSRPDALSGGMRQRVALIRTFLPGRDVLLDEPFGALDAITRSDLQLWLLDLQERTGQSVLMVTHDIEEAILLSDRIYVMSPRPGRILACVEVPSGRPRSYEILQSQEFGRVKTELLRVLRDGIANNPDIGQVA